MSDAGRARASPRPGLATLPTSPGTFGWTARYETENRIQASAQGRPGNGPPGEEGTNVVGQFSFVAPDDGQTYSVQYTADENGFVPQV